MSRKLPPNHPLIEYSARPGLGRWLVFWPGYTFETLTRRRLSRIVKWRSWGIRVEVQGLENIPKGPGFILAANHYRGWPVLDVIAVIFKTVRLGRPELANNCAVIIGERERRQPSPPPLPARLLRRGYRWMYRRWALNTALLPLDNRRASVKTLREWRIRVQHQPMLVFPEGKARLEFGLLRRGSGRWAASLGVPVVPVGVWWHKAVWQVRIGRPVNWSPRNELHDVQLGLGIAHLLPPELAPRWQKGLSQWPSQDVRNYS